MAREHTSRGLRDEASVGPAPRQASELKRLGDLNYKVADGEPDIRGWTVYASTGRELGRVDDLLVDVDAGEVVMLDVDLRREDRHTLAPIRAAWIDHATRRVVLDAREVESDDRLPAFPRSGALSDADVRRFNDDYVHAYGERGVEDARGWRLRRGDEELRFGMTPRADLPPADARRLDEPTPTADRERERAAAVRHEAWEGSGTVTGAPAPGTSSDAPALDESRRIDRIMEDAPPPRHHAQAHAPEPRLSSVNFVADDRALDATGASASASAAGERRSARVDDASALEDAQGIEPRELDGRVRIDEGATVDEHTPMGGVRYDAGERPREGYGRPDERYGPEYGSGRIGFDRVVTRHPLAGDDDPADRPTGGATGGATSGATGSDRPSRDDGSERRTESVPVDLSGDPRGDASRTVRYRRYTGAPPSDERR